MAEISARSGGGGRGARVRLRFVSIVKAESAAAAGWLVVGGEVGARPGLASTSSCGGHTRPQPAADERLA